MSRDVIVYHSTEVDASPPPRAGWYIGAAIGDELIHDESAVGPFASEAEALNAIQEGKWI